MSPGRHPLSDVVQSIHLEHPSPQGLSRFIVSTFPSPAVGEPIIVLYGSGRRGELYVWSSKPGKHKLDGKWEQAAEAVKGGYLHLDFTQSGDVFDEEGSGDIELHPPGLATMRINMHSDENGAFESLFEATLNLLSRPLGGGDKSELRALQAELSKKDAEIALLNARLQSVKASASRSAPTDKKKLPQSPQKKAPANASALQPNQKRRKAVQDEFAGSSDDEEDD